MGSSRTAFDWPDRSHIGNQLTEGARALRETSQQYCQDRLLPHVQEPMLSQSG